MGHTPGPFRIIPAPHMGEHPNHEFRFIGTADFDEEMGNGQVLAKLKDSPEIVGNAHLFAASPDLLAACKAALIEIEAAWQAEGTYFGPDADVDKKIKAAIARAEGTK